MRKPEDFTILIVDDEERLRQSLKKHFKLDNYNVLTAGGGYEALDIINEKKIDFVISDIRMPEGDGEMLLKKIRELNPKIPMIVMVTGFAEMSKEEAIKGGALDLLAKPIDIDLLEEYIAEQLNRQ